MYKLYIHMKSIVYLHKLREIHTYKYVFNTNLSYYLNVCNGISVTPLGTFKPRLVYPKAA